MFPENQGPGREKFTFVDFGGGDRCRRHLIDLTVTGEVKTLYNYFLCCLTNLHAVFSPGNPVDKPPLVVLSVGTSVYRRDFPTSVSQGFPDVGFSRVGLSVGTSVYGWGFLYTVAGWGFPCRFIGRVVGLSAGFPERVGLSVGFPDQSESRVHVRQDPV